MEILGYFPALFQKETRKNIPKKIKKYVSNRRKKSVTYEQEVENTETQRCRAKNGQKHLANPAVPPIGGAKP